LKDLLKLSTPVKYRFNHLLLIVFGSLLLFKCTASNEISRYQGSTAPTPVRYQNQFTVPNQTLPNDVARSIQLYRGSPGQAPIIQLGSSQSVTLRFDDLLVESSMFRIEITHHNSDWSPSSLLPNFYLQGFQTDFISGGNPSRFQNPSYHTYTYTFPNQNIRITRSGNYIIHVYRQETNQKLFSMPFLVHENIGTASVSIEELFNQDARYLRHHQPFAYYKYEDTSIIPQSDLSVYFVQNQFWGQARRANQEDFSEQYNARLYLSRDRSFIGSYEAYSLSMSNIDQYSPQIIDFEQLFSISRVTLNRDVVNLNISPTLRGGGLINNPSSNNSARYALVQFQLEVPELERTSNPIYLVGGFNSWGINPANQMYWNASSRMYTGQAIIKEGSYSYKYVTLEGNRVNDTILDASFASTRQEYHALVYQRDHTFLYDRLVSVANTTSE
jgi:hypothetical protein